jgi:DNA-binding IclR family transcriptional regulator
VRELGTLEKFTSKTHVTAMSLVEDLLLTRERGWSFNAGERYEGVVGVAAPVFDSTGRFVAAVGIQGPEVRVDQNKVVGAVSQAAARLKGRLRAQ